MNLSFLKWFIIIVAVSFIFYTNNRFEIFAVNIPKVKSNEKAEGCFRVMTWNINAPLGTEDVEYVRNGLISEIEKQDPDILCLQELSQKIFKEIQNSLDSVFGYTDSMVIKNEPLRYMIYSRKPIRNFKRYKSIKDIDTIGFNQEIKKEIKLLKRQLPVFSADIEVEPDQWVSVFSVHFRSSAYSTARRSMDEDASWREGLPLYYNNYALGQKIRNWEADNIRIILDSLETKQTPIILAGDFNDWSGSYCMNTIRNELYKDAWWERGIGFGITYSAWHLLLRLDHILYNHYFHLDKVDVLKSDFSDHYPIVADYYLN